LPASNGWSNIFFSADNTVQGAHDGGWLIGRRGAVGSITGAIGDFTIEE
jgi:DNA polymerase III alpha subunit (gram-positive type)